MTAHTHALTHSDAHTLALRLAPRTLRDVAAAGIIAKVSTRRAPGLLLILAILDKIITGVRNSGGADALGGACDSRRLTPMDLFNGPDGGRRTEERARGTRTDAPAREAICPALLIHPSSFILHPSSFAARQSIIYLSLLGFLLLSGCSTRHKPAMSPVHASSEGVNAGAVAAKSSANTAKSNSAQSADFKSAYVGSSVCAQCHQAEYKKWSGSRHSETMRAMNPADLGPVAPPVGVIAGTPFEITRSASGQFAARLTKDPQRYLTLTLAFGSGRTGLTYVEVRGGKILEFHESYFPSKKLWYPTPGSGRLPRLSPGMEHGVAMSRKCVLCHATAITGPGPTPPKKFFGVGCERCHGPGSAHVAAMRAGDYQNLLMDDISSWSATRINTLCGQCHRTADTIDLGNTEAATTNRFQPYGLMLSRCFRESGKTLSCLNCHDPHTNNSTDIRHYERACLKCHSPAGSQMAGAAAAHPGKVCPVNPTSGCISCHMPRRAALPGNPLPVNMPDHWIRIFTAHSP
ncbi:MAG TPA: multiheme c-type cytochrome [Armatimonadota bacterium]|nr:multiheme c-type cytochrome [Armatimonadota bacterium]